MSVLSVRLFGRFCIEAGERPLPGFDASKLQELFSYLMLFRSAPQTSESFAFAFWGVRSSGQS